MSKINGRDLAYDLARSFTFLPRWATVPVAFVGAALLAPLVWSYSVPLLVVAIVVSGIALGLAVKAKRSLAGWLLGLWAAGLLFAGIAGWAGHREWTAYAVLGGLALTVGGVVVVTGRYVVPPGTTKRILERMSEEDQAADNAARRLDIMQHASPGALRALAPVLRPSMAGMTRRQRRKIPATDLGALILYMGYRWLPGEEVWADCESVTGIVAPPRSGKTGLLANILIDAPGAAVTTSTRPDLAEWGQEARAKLGPVVCWNPTEYLDVPSIIMGGPRHGQEVRWPVIAGCRNYATAVRRGANMIPGNGDLAAARWDQSARALLAVLLHAADLGGYTMYDVQRWVADEGDGEGSLAEIVPALRKLKGADARVTTVRQHYSTNGNTKTSVTFTLRNQALDWLNNDVAASLAACAPKDGNLDLAELVRQNGTLHLLGRDEGVGPLNACLVGEIAHVARTIAARMPDQRLDPPLTMILDEAAISAPVPLHEWTADMGGSGIVINYSVQSLSQLEARYGKHNASVTRGNTNNLIRLGGGTDSEELDSMAKLSGSVRRRVHGEDIDHGLEDHRWGDTVDAARLRSLPKFTGILYRSNMRTAVGKIPLVWKREPKPVKIPLGLAAQELAAAKALEDVQAEGDTGAMVLPAQREVDKASKDAD